MVKLVDNLNVEIVLGIVILINDVVKWIGYLYLFVWMRRNLMVYGIDWFEYSDDF